MSRLTILLTALFLSISVRAAVVGNEVTYETPQTRMQGYLAYDEEVKGKRPGVLVVHEWWGHNEYARKRADQLAELGYVALAVDMYGGGKQASHPEDAGKFASEVKSNMEQAEARFRAAMELLKEQSLVEDNNIAAIGYCFGGGIVLEMARRGLPLDAVASFHGSLGTDDPVGEGVFDGEILVANGGADPFVKLEQIEAFIREMETAAIKYTFVSYPGVKHSFTNPGADARGEEFGLPLVYDAEADRDSWEMLKAMLVDVFGTQD